MVTELPIGTIYRIEPGGEPEEFVRLHVQNVWALALDGEGGLWAATGPPGKLYRISQGKPEVALSAADRHITCLALGDDGTVFAGTSPLGKVYAVSADGSARSVCELEDAAIQSIGVDAQGNVYVGTSPKARVLKISPEGVPTEILRVKGRHIQALLVWPTGTVLAAENRLHRGAVCRRGRQGVSHDGGHRTSGQPGLGGRSGRQLSIAYTRCPGAGTMGGSSMESTRARTSDGGGLHQNGSHGPPGWYLEPVGTSTRRG
jgi:hypothetical protein